MNGVLVRLLIKKNNKIPIFRVLYLFLWFSEDRGKSCNVWLRSAPEFQFGECVAWWRRRFTVTRACNSLFNMCYTSSLCASFTDLLQLEHGATSLKLSTFRLVAVGELDWSLLMDAADLFVWGMCLLNSSRKAMWLYVSCDLMDNWVIGMFLLISMPENFWIHLVFWLETGRQEEKGNLSNS